MLARLTELMFVGVLRHHMQGRSAGQLGWLAALNDPVVGAALRCLHEAPGASWTVERLARGVGVSRTVLADRFHELLEQPPMHYLARWRMQVATHLLRTTDAPVKEVARRAGYETESAFSRAFKRALGRPPASWRRSLGR
jgi:transcriptional regulator GlxA family with amidase domain